MLHMCDVLRLTVALCVFAHASDLNLNKFACSWTSLSSSISFGAALLLRNVESWGARWYHIRCYFPTDSWLGRRWGAVVSTTKCSEQNHKFKEKELRGHPNSKIQSQDLLLWNRFPKQASRSCCQWLCGLSARSPGNLPTSSLRLKSLSVATTG